MTGVGASIRLPGNRQIGERTPRRLGEETPVVDAHFREGCERLQIDLLPGRGSSIELPGDPRREVPEPVDRALTGKQQSSQPDRIQPFEGSPLQRSVIQIEPVDIDSRSHARP